jgi:hypothetical protein
MSNNLVYLASPYSKYPGGRKKAFKLVCKKAAELMVQGEHIFCPIAHSHPIEVEGMGGHQQDGDFWLDQDFAVLSACSKMFVYRMAGWEDSEGVARELAFAKQHKIPVEYID